MVKLKLRFLLVLGIAFGGQLSAMDLFADQDEEQQDQGVLGQRALRYNGLPDQIEVVFDNGNPDDDQDILVLDRVVYETMPTLKEMISGPGAKKLDGTPNNQIIFKSGSSVTPQALSELVRLTISLQQVDEQVTIDNREKNIKKVTSHLINCQPTLRRSQKIELLGQIAQAAHFLESEVEGVTIYPETCNVLKKIITNNDNYNYHEIITDTLEQLSISELLKNDLVCSYQNPITLFKSGRGNKIKLNKNGTITTIYRSNNPGALLNLDILDQKTGKSFSAVKKSLYYISENGNLLITEADNLIEIINSTSGAVIQTIESFGTHFVKLSPDEKLLIIGTQAGIRVWDIQKQQDKCFLNGRGAAFNESGDFLFINTEKDESGSYKIEVYDSETMQKVREFDEIMSHKFNLNNEVLVLDYKPENAIIFYDAQTLFLKAKFFKEVGISVCGTKDFLIHAYKDENDTSKIDLWNAKIGKKVRTISGNKAICHPYKALFTIHTFKDEEYTKVWNTESGDEVAQIEGHSVEFSGNGHVLVTESHEKTELNYPKETYLWNVDSWEKIATLKNCGKFVPSNSKRYLIFKNGTTITLWDFQTKRTVFLDLNQDNLLSVKFSKDETLIGFLVDGAAIQHDDSKFVIVFDIRKNKWLENRRAVSFEFSQDSGLLITRDKNNDIHFYEMLHSRECLLYKYFSLAELYEFIKRQNVLYDSGIKWLKNEYGKIIGMQTKDAHGVISSYL